MIINSIAVVLPTLAIHQLLFRVIDGMMIVAIQCDTVTQHVPPNRRLLDCGHAPDRYIA